MPTDVSQIVNVLQAQNQLLSAVLQALLGPRADLTVTGLLTAGSADLLGLLLMEPVAGTANSDSQTIELDARDGTNTVRAVTIKAQHTASGAAILVAAAAGDVILSPSAGSVVDATQPVQLPHYTVATLPAASAAYANCMAVVTDATLPTYNGALVGSGAVVVPVFCDGTSWTSH